MISLSLLVIVLLQAHTSSTTPRRSTSSVGSWTCLRFRGRPTAVSRGRLRCAVLHECIHACASLHSFNAALPPTNVQVRHDGSGRRNGWHLAWAKVTNATTGAVALFKCNRWVDLRGHDDPGIVGVVLAQPPVPEGMGPRPVRARAPVARTPSADLPRGPSYGCSYEYYDAPADDGEVCAVPRRAVVLRRGFAGSVIPRLVPCVRPCGPDSIFRVMGRGAELCPICFYFESMGGFQTKLLVDRLLMFWKVNCVPSERAMISSFPENVAPASALAASLAP